jgi:hypothetical protein
VYFSRVHLLITDPTTNVLVTLEVIAVLYSKGTSKGYVETEETP